MDESIATYRALRERGVPTQLIWYSGGHSGPNAPGDLDEAKPDPVKQYVTGRLVDWVDRQLKGASTAPVGPTFAYFQNWTRYRGNARAAYAESGAVDSGVTKALAFSGTNGLVADGALADRGTARLTTPTQILPTGSDRPDGLGVAGVVEKDAPGSFARWQSTPLNSDVDVVGSPITALSVTARRDGRAVAANALVLFVRIVDIDPAGRTSTVGDLVAPVRDGDPVGPFTVTMPAIVHRFGAGHRIGVVVSGGSNNYRRGEPGISVSIPALSGRLDLPVR